MTEGNGDHLLVPISAKWLASGTDDDGSDNEEDDDNDDDDDGDDGDNKENEDDDEEYEVDDCDDNDDDDDGDVLPFWEVIFPAESARRRWLLSSVGFRPVAAAKHGNFSISRVSIPGGFYRRKGAPRGATRHPGGCLARLGGAAPGTLLATWWVPSPPSSVSPSQFPK